MSSFPNHDHEEKQPVKNEEAGYSLPVEDEFTSNHVQERSGESNYHEAAQYGHTATDQ